MSRLGVFAEQYDVSEVAIWLLEHRADRDALLASLASSLEADNGVRAAWLWGSFGRGDADDLSDLDPWLIVADDAVEDMGRRLRLYAEQTGSFITGGEAPHNAPPGGGFFSSLHEGRHGLLHVDCYWQPHSAASEAPERAVLFNRLHEPVAAPPADPPGRKPVAASPEDGRIEGGIGFAWLMLSIAAKTLARHPDSDMALMMYPRPGLEEAAVLLGMENYVGPSDWAVPNSPREKVEILRHVAGKTAQLTEVANSRGIDVSPRTAACLTRYLGMVAAILR